MNRFFDFDIRGEAYVLLRDSNGNPRVDDKLEDLPDGLRALLTEDDIAFLKEKEASNANS